MEVTWVYENSQKSSPYELCTSLGVCFTLIIILHVKKIEEPGAIIMPVILAIWEADIGRIVIQGQPWQVVSKTPFPK
jgi:hypothetical protein